MNQTTLSLEWLNSKPKYMNRKMNSHPHTMTLEPIILNVCIMICMDPLFIDSWNASLCKAQNITLDEIKVYWS
jgi:hypothetical protein